MFIKENIKIGSASSSELLADLYIPPTNKSNGAAILFVHGGGWREGNKDQLKGYAILLALSLIHI
mgnify:CR=1 FL=1